MSSAETIRVTGPGDLCGTIDTGAWPMDGSRSEVLVRLEGGASVLVPLKALVQQSDGSYHLTLHAAALERPDVGVEMSAFPLVWPVIEESLDVRIVPVEGDRVRVRKMVHEREEVVDPPLRHDEVIIERVPINRMVDGPISARSEEGTLVIPLLEEVLTVEKRLLLREELRVTVRQMETHRPQRVTLRREEAVVERVHQEDSERDRST